MKPSEITFKSITGTRKTVPSGWVPVPACTINGDGFTVEFERLSICTIDPQCDALNGYYNVWSKWYIKLTTPTFSKSLAVTTAQADKLHDILSNISSTSDDDGTNSASKNAEIAFTTIANFIMS